jgi:hypothetical protein
VQGDKLISDGCADKLLSEVERIGGFFYSFMEVGVRRREAHFLKTVQLFVHEESFNQPIFFCNNLSGKVYPVSHPTSGFRVYPKP